jgi:hypothetical protein
VQWVAIVVGVGMFLGLRDRTSGGSTHVTLLVVVVAVVAAMYFLQLK